MNINKHLMLLALLTNYSYANGNNITIPIEITQDAFHYISHKDLDKNIIDKYTIRQMNEYFNTQYYFQWSDDANQDDFYYVPNNTQTKNNILKLENDTIRYYKERSGYDKNYLPHTSNWVNSISENMNLKSFPNIPCDNHSCRGIVVNNAQVRSLPTSDAFYNNFTIPGEGYPFDYIQLSALWTGTPIMLIHMSTDKKWTLIKGQGTLGWVPTSSIANVDESFITQWKRYRLVTPTVRKQDLPIEKYDINNKILEAGSILPEHKGKLKIPVKDKNGTAALLTVNSKNLKFTAWPMTPSYKNFAHQINNYIGMPYGWGGMDFNNDCSGLLKRLFSTFGIWLPRSSFYQANYAGQIYSMYDQSEEQRKELLVEQEGSIQLIPFMTLVSFGNSKTSTSHIGLYMGTTEYNHNKVAIMFNAPWGVKLVNGNNEQGRALVGQTLITPIGIGDAFTEGLSNQDWALQSLWNAVGFNTTLLTETPKNKRLYQGIDNSYSIEKYLFEK
ncbi:TPA: SH3 domain-containing protein [Photobacterium damselae]